MKQLNDEILKSTNEMWADRPVVFGDGDKNAIIMLIGEAPGAEEVKEGRPFVGKAGKNLNEFLEILGLNRENLYISNVVKVRPTKNSPKTGKPINRPPNREELELFVPYLQREIQLVKPEFIVTLGNFALKNTLMDNKITIGECHGALIEYNGFKVFPLYHPASIIYNRALSEVYQQDLLKLKELL